VAAAVIACAGPKAHVEIETSAPRMPYWAKGHVPEPGGHMFFLGTVQGAATLDKGRQRAMESALAQAARYIGTHIEQKSGGAAGKEEREAKTRALISRARQDDIYTERTRRIEPGVTIDSWDVYLLVAIPWVTLEAERSRKAGESEKLMDEAQDLVQQARRLLRRGKALRAHARAQEAEERISRVEGASKRRAKVGAAVKDLLARTRRAARSFVLLTSARDRAVAEAFRDTLEGKLSAAGFRAVAIPAPIPPQRVESVVGGGPFRLGSRLGRDTAYAVLATVQIEPGGVVFGKRAANAHIRLVVIATRSGDRLITLTEHTREFGPGLPLAARNAARAAAQKAAKAILKKLDAK